ncbi:Prophage tail length tape measure protein [compost metagenome]
MSASQFSQYRESIDNIVGTSRKAAEALTLMESSGRISGEVFEKVAVAAISFERATGTAMKDVIADFASLGKDPVNAAVTLDEKYKFLTSSVLAQADALVRQGKEQEATTLLQGEMAEATESASVRMVEQLNVVGRTLKGLKDGVSELIDEFYKLGRVDTTADKLAAAQKELANLPKTDEGGARRLAALGIDVSNGRRKALEDEIKGYKQRLQYEEMIAGIERENEIRRRESVASTDRLQSNRSQYLDSVARATESLNAVERDAVRIKEQAKKENRELTASEKDLIEVNRTGAQKKLDEAKEKAGKPKPAGPLDTREIQDVKSSLSVITSEYDAHYKKVTALGDANIVSAAATAASQKAILDAESKAISAAYDEQIAAIEKLKGNKKNSAAQNISLDNQLSKAQDAQLKAQQDIAAKREVIGIKERADIDKRTESILAYNEALQQQIDNTRTAGQRAVAAVGQGDRVGKLNDDLASADRDFAKEQLKLSKVKGTMDPEEYATKLKDLTDAHTEMRDVIISNDKDIQKANGQWTNGLTKALQNAADEGANFAATVNAAVGGAFDSMGDAFGEFVTTGKLSFRDLTTSILTDMAKLAAKQASSALLSSLFGAVLSGIGGTGTNGFAAGSAAATSSATGASRAGYNNISSWQEKGGAWTGGTQMFANGGAFTNSIVSEPTSFGMANGAKGVMGEKKPEAIIPLSRTSTGELGVRMTGAMGGSGGSIINVNINVAEGSSTSNSDGGAGWNQFGNEIGSIVEQRVYKIINSETRPGGSLQPQNGR